MEKIKITADSTCDLSQELIKMLDLDIMRFFVNLGEQIYRDGKDVSPNMLFDYVAETKTLPKTAAPSPQDYITMFAQYADDYDSIIHFNISSSLSAANQNANAASAEFKNVYVIDSESLSTGTSLLMLKADEWRKEGKSGKEIADGLNALKNRVQASFVIDSCEYLHKGGRCSSMARIGATIFKIHPMLLLKEGKITVHKKIKGKIKNVYVEYLNTLKKEFPNPENSYAFITHTYMDMAIIEELKETVKKLYPFKEIYITDAGCTVTSHCGEGTMGLLFINDTEI